MPVLHYWITNHMVSCSFTPTPLETSTHQNTVFFCSYSDNWCFLADSTQYLECQQIILVAAWLNSVESDSSLMPITPLNCSHHLFQWNDQRKFFGYATHFCLSNGNCHIFSLSFVLEKSWMYFFLFPSFRSELTLNWNFIEFLSLFFLTVDVAVSIIELESALLFSC